MNPLLKLAAAGGLAGGLAVAADPAEPDVQLAQGGLQGPVAAVVLEVLDGDSLRARAQIWLDQYLEVIVRLHGIDTPEIRQAKCPAERQLGLAAKAALGQLAPPRSEVLLYDVRRDKYGGRVVATVVDARGDDARDKLITAGHAAPYDGSGPRRSWCNK